MSSDGEFHKIVTKRINELASFMNFMSALNSNLTKLIIERDRVKGLTNEPKVSLWFREEHLNCLKDVELINDKIQKVEGEIKLICSNTEGLIRILDENNGASDESRTKGTSQETSALKLISKDHNIVEITGSGKEGRKEKALGKSDLALKSISRHNNIFGLGNIGDQSAIRTEGSAVTFKYKNFNFYLPRSEEEHCIISFPDPSTSAMLIPFYMPPSVAGLGTISIFEFSAEASSDFLNDETSNFFGKLNFGGDRLFYGIGATRHCGNVDIPWGALLICTAGIDNPLYVMYKCSIGVGVFAIDACGPNDCSITLQNNDISRGELHTRIGGSCTNRIIMDGNRMPGRELHFRIVGSGHTCIEGVHNDISDGKLHITTSGSGSSNITLNRNDFWGAKLHMTIDGRGSTKVTLARNNICNGKLHPTINGSGSSDIIISKNNFRGGKLHMTIDGSGRSKVLLKDNDIHKGELHLTIDGSGDTEVVFNNNFINSGELHVRICGTGHTRVILHDNNLGSGKLYITVDGSGTTELSVERNNICGSAIIKINESDRREDAVFRGHFVVEKR